MSKHKPNNANAKSLDNAPITNEPEITGNQGTGNESPEAQPQPSGLPKRITGLNPSDPTDKEGNFTGEGVQEKTPVAPQETRNASRSPDRIEEQHPEQLAEKYPASDIGPKTVPPYNPIPEVGAAYKQAQEQHLKEFNSSDPKMGED